MATRYILRRINTSVRLDLILYRPGIYNLLVVGERSRGRAQSELIIFVVALSLRVVVWKTVVEIIVENR